jgi:hypothetical protein
MTATVRRPAPASIARIAVAQRLIFGVLHDPAGCYTVGPYRDASVHWGGNFAVLAHTCRADHSRERVFTTTEDARASWA